MIAFFTSLTVQLTVVQPHNGQFTQRCKYGLSFQNRPRGKKHKKTKNNVLVLLFCQQLSIIIKLILALSI